MPELLNFTPTRSAALARATEVDPEAYARTRNALGGAVSGLSPYLTHGLLTLPEALALVCQRQPLPIEHKWVYELGWRAYFRHVWQHRGAGILSSLHAGPLPDAAYATDLPEDIRNAATGVPVIDQAVRTLYATGYLHNHARMWLASYIVHLRKVHWRTGADWLYTHLLDGDLASNHLSWQWVAGTGSKKPYLFNADNVARYAPPAWRSPATVVDQSYEALDALARSPKALTTAALKPPPAALEPISSSVPLAACLTRSPDPAQVAGRDVWLVHPWSLGPCPADLPKDTLVLGVYLADFHADWPWNEHRWRFVGSRMIECTQLRWFGSSAAIGRALQSARSVGSQDEPHAKAWGLADWARCRPEPSLFAPQQRRFDSFSSWWARATHGLESASELLDPLG